MFPKAGAEFEYPRHAFPAWVAFVVGWIMFAGLIVAAAAVALGFGLYLGRFVEVSARIGGLALLAFVGVVAWSGIRRSARLTVLLSIVQVAGLLYVIIIGVPHVGEVDLLSGNRWCRRGARRFCPGVLRLHRIRRGHHTRRGDAGPDPNGAAALLLALGISTALYVGVADRGRQRPGGSRPGRFAPPLADVIDHTLGGRGADLLAVVALIATTNTTLLCVTATSRLQYGMASAPSAAGPVRTGSAAAVTRRNSRSSCRFSSPAGSCSSVISR